MRWTRRACGPRRGSKAQSLTEFALIIPLFFILLFGIIDIGRLESTYLTLQNALRQAGRFAVTGQKGSESTREASIIQVAKQTSGLNDLTVIVSSQNGGITNAGAGGDTVTIRVDYPLQLITPLIGQFFSNGWYTISASTTFKNEPFS